MFSVTNYAGFSIGVSSGTATAPPTTGLIGWYDFSDSSSLVMNGSFITTASDKSGNGYHATGPIFTTGTSTITQYPTTAAAAQNGLTAGNFAAVSTNSASDGLNPRMNLPAMPFAWSYAVVGVTTRSDVSGQSPFIVAQRANTTNGLNVQAGTTAAYNQNSNNSGFATISLNAWHLLSVYATTSTGSYYPQINADGTATTSSLNKLGTNSASATYGAIGNQANSSNIPANANYGWAGNIGEIRIFHSPLLLADVQKEEGYLAWKWGLQGNLPGTHPYKNAPP